MTPEEEQAQLEEVGVSGRNRSPGIIQRAENAPAHFAPGTILPTIRGILNPRLYRERGDTSALVSSVLGDDGALRRLVETNPDLATAIRQQADTPMTSGEHEKFRSSLLGMVGDEVARNQKVQYQLKDNKGFFDAYSTLRGFLPGAGNDKIDTREEYEDRQIQSLYQQAQEIALVDPDHSATIMGEVKKRADALTDNVRTDMEKQRRVARAEDSSLWSTYREKISETRDVSEALLKDLDEKGIRRAPNQALVSRALTLLGRAGDFPAAGIQDTAESVVNAVPGRDSTAGNVLGEVVNLGAKAAEKALEAGDVKYLVQRLQFNAGQVEKSYAQDRAALADKYKASGLQFGDKPGEIYSVPNEAYTREAEKIKAAPKKATDDTDSLHGMLTEEVTNATAAVEKEKPHAAANVPGAAARFAAATERLQIAKDDARIFEADQLKPGQAAPVVEGVDAGVELQAARKRRAARQQMQGAAQAKAATMEALRGYTR